MLTRKMAAALDPNVNNNDFNEQVDTNQVVNTAQNNAEPDAEFESDETDNEENASYISGIQHPDMEKDFDILVERMQALENFKLHASNKMHTLEDEIRNLQDELRGRPQYPDANACTNQMVQILKDEISFLRLECSTKNKLIENLSKRGGPAWETNKYPPQNAIRSHSSWDSKPPRNTNSAENNQRKSNEDKRQHPWNTVGHRNSDALFKTYKADISNPIQNQMKSGIHLSNRYSPLFDSEQNVDENEDTEDDRTAFGFTNADQVKLKKRIYDLRLDETVSKSKKYTKKAKTIAIFSDSISKNVRGKDISKRLTDGKAFVRPFVGATANTLNYHISPTLSDNDELCAAVVQVGVNNILKSKRGNEKQDAAEIAAEIIDVGKSCTRSGIDNVFISSITCVVNDDDQTTIESINNILLNKCKAESFHFINNNNISRKEICADGLHLSPEGVRMLTTNYVNNLNKIL